MRDILERRQRSTDDVLPQEVDEYMEEKELVAELEAAAKEYKEFQKSVAATNVPLWGDIDVNAKRDDVIRLLSGNLNGLAAWNHNNHKADRLRFLMTKLGLDVVGLQEVCVNWSALKPSHNIGTILRNGDEPIRSVASHNKLETKNAGRAQRGGTATVIRDLLAPFVKDSNVDHTKLGRWSWCVLEAEGGHRTRVVTAYSPVTNSATGLRTTVQQQWRYIRKKGLKTTPRQMFQDDLINLLRLWREKGDRLVLLMDANDHVVDGELAMRLRGEGLAMEEAVHSRNPGQGPPTHFRGSQPIDGIWVTPDVEVCGAAYLPFDACLGDHRPVLVDVSMKSFLGSNMPRIVPAAARKLTSKVGRIRQKYIDDVEKAFKAHGIFENLLRLQDQATYPVKEDVRKALEAIDQLVVKIMLAAEKGCRKFRMGPYEFSPQIKALMDRCWALRSLIGYKLKKKGNIANLYRFAWRTCGIERPSSIPIDDLVAMWKVAKAELKRHLAESPWMRKQYLTEQLREALENERLEEATRIRNSLRCESKRKEWRGIKRVTKGKQQTATLRLEEPLPDGSVRVARTKEEVEEMIPRYLGDRFGSAGSADVCNGALFELLGYSADTETAVKILEGTWTPPPLTPPTTILILEEVAKIWKKMADREVDIVVTRDDFQYYWRRKREKTSSSYSRVHMGHYVSCSYSKFLSEVHALKLSLITKTGSTPDRWAQGLNVILEKTAGIALITKMRAILLMEADFNFHNKLIFGKRMLDLARDHDMVPEEIYNDKGRTSEDGLLQQVLVYDLARQWRRPLLVASIDASQCYQR